MTLDFDLVVPTIGRPSLGALLQAIADQDGPRPGRVVLVDDRPDASEPLAVPHVGVRARDRIEVVRSGGRGPAAARNAGWRHATATWIVFVDDDVVPCPGWLCDLGEDLAALGALDGGSQGRLHVPLPRDRRPTDWERSTRGLEDARWITADMAYRRAALAAVGGFDERFPAAYREDADLALRVQSAGWALHRGRRRALHPVRPADRWVSVRAQRGNADDALMRARHGHDWRLRAGASRGRLGLHTITLAAALIAVAGLALRRPRLATAGAVTYLGLLGELAVARVRPGPCTRDELETMLLTTPLLAPTAVAHRVVGTWRVRRDAAHGIGPHEPRCPARGGPDVVVLFDRDGTLVEDVPYNRDPAKVRALPGAADAIDRLRHAGIPVGVVSNQSGIGRGLVSEDAVRAVNRRVEDLLGPFDAFLYCPHAPEARCECRKPAPGLIRRAADELGVPPERCVVIGDIGADVDAAAAAGARGILVPNGRTRPEEVAAATLVARDLDRAVDLVLGSAARRGSTR